MCRLCGRLFVGLGFVYLYSIFVGSRVWVKAFIILQVLSCGMYWSKIFGVSSVCCLLNFSL